MAKSVINWGSSVPLVDLPDGNSARELVRIELAEPRDVTLYLGNPGDAHVAGGTGAVRVRATIEHGAGGVSHSTEIAEVPPQGLVWHVAAKSVRVRVTRSTAASTPGPRFTAYAALGRPSPFVVSHTTFSVPPAAAWTHTLKPWVRAIRLRVLEGVDAEMQLQWISGAVNGVGGSVSTQYTTTAAEMGDGLVAVVNTANAVRITNTGAAPAAKYRIEHHGEM